MRYRTLTHNHHYSDHGQHGFLISIWYHYVDQYASHSYYLDHVFYCMIFIVLLTYNLVLNWVCHLFPLSVNLKLFFF